MQALKLPSRAGWRWLTEGFALFRANPGALSMLAVGYWLVVAFVNVVPFIGPVIGSLLMPALSVGVMNGARAIDRKEEATPAMLFSAFRENLQGLVALGGSYLVITLVVLGITALIDGGMLMGLMTGAGDEVDFADPSFATASQVALVLMMPVVMAWWYAPLLVSWQGMPVGKSLFFSLVASWRNKGAFLTYSLGLMLLAGILPVILFGLLSKLLGGASMLVGLMLAPLMFVLLPTIFASFYVSYRDVFVDEEGAAAGDVPPAPHVDINV